MESYFKESPQRFFSNSSFEIYYGFLKNLQIKEPQKLVKILRNREHQLSLAIQSLEETNKKEIHNIRLPKEYDLNLFIDKYIHFEILKLWESPFYEFLYLVASISREIRGKSSDGLDLFNVVEEIDKLDKFYGSFEVYQNLYDKTIRNGIGHGNVEFLEGRIRYLDKKETREIYSSGIVEMFDDLVDTVNAFCLALRLFYLTNTNFLKKNNLNIPNSLLLQELFKSGIAPKWEIKACLETTVLEKKQLNIFIDTSLRNLTLLRINIFFTGILAAELTNKYNTISLRLNNRGITGLAMFDADKVRQINIQKQVPTLVDYIPAYLQKYELIFFMKFKEIRILEKLFGIWLSGKSLLPLYIKKVENPIKIISTNIYSKGLYSVVEGTIFVNNIEDINYYVKENVSRIVNYVVKYAKRKCSFASSLRFLPAKFITINVFDSEVRCREWRISKLDSKKICFIRMNTTLTIKIPNIFPELTEQIGKYQIVWQNKSVENMIDEELF